MELTVHARGQMATKLLDAAEHLGLGPEVIRSQSEGFLVPEEVHRYLFPSEYDQPDGDGDQPDADQVDEYDALDFAELRDAAKARDLSAGGSAEEIKARLREADAAKADEPEVVPPAPPAAGTGE